MLSALLGDNEVPAVEVVNEHGQGNLLLVCDHASNRIPEKLQSLGLSGPQLTSHISWDPGAAEVARKLSARLDSPLVLSAYSRLVIDCNRFPDSPEAICGSSDGNPVPGNAFLPKEEICRRQKALFEPYQARISSLLEMTDKTYGMLLSIHSFTPILSGISRPWSIGVCYRNYADLAAQWIEALRTTISSERFSVGDNQPYAVDTGIDYTIPEQGERRGIPAIMLEIRQDLIHDQAGIQMWSDIIADACIGLGK